MTKDELRQKANDLPLAPGVYLMMDKTGKVIYVGKAKKLKNRVSQYFQDTASHNEKTRAMVSQVDHFDTIFVSTEFEALILENSLIKRHMPRYNILLKDDKGYPFVRLDADAAYPRFSLVGKTADDGAKYFGPFGGRRETRLAIEAVCGALRLPICTRQFPRDIGRERPCLNHHIGRCDGFCRPDGPGQAEYQARIRQAVRIFSGHYRQLTAELRQEMEQAAEELNFEKAAALRDRIRAISVLGKTQQVIAGVCADTDVWGVYPGQVRCGSAVLHIEDGNLLGREVEVFSALKDWLNDGTSARSFECDEDDAELIATSELLSLKPIIYAANLDEDGFADPHGVEYYRQVEARSAAEGAQVIPVCAKLEAEIAELPAEEKAMFLEDLGISQSGLDRLIQASYTLLGLISFLTAGEDECRAWTITKGTKAPQAAGKIHSDFERGFIRAETIAFEDLKACGSMAAAREKGLIRSEGKDYVVQDGDIILFRFNV